MRFPDLHRGVLLARRQRFLAEIRLDDGRDILAHCPNTGRMLGYSAPGLPVWASRREPGGRCGWTWELAELGQTLVGVHPARANALALEAIAAGRIPALAGYDQVLREVSYGREGSRIDLLLRSPGRPDCYVEVKSVTAADEFGLGIFPDAVSARGLRHLRELQAVAAAGARAVLLFCVQRDDVLAVRAASEIDPAYARGLAQAGAAGVEILAWQCAISPREIVLRRRLPLLR
ncbi:sugar fermentation stimulation protein [Tahibacter aquaticus]|uniref:Sugar fermentation stimulation protein homolog n=1 Tax=Tahibacter aquaticus TaxID=520092 RepID=A0A4R6Z6Q4_9GAMM|nr:DNA/RNA nuclease SfsA [Tahibacter aquaticus]TDR47450.1 sugar fermentation stimulation protein [Tahibacter aquaticus]